MLSKTSMTHPVILWSAVVLSVSGTVPNGEIGPLAAIDEAGGCTDTDHGAKDSAGDGCVDYKGHTGLCESWDTSDFKSKDMCCACGGGKRSGKGDCSCINHTTKSGFGNCLKDYTSNGKQGPICYVEPNSCGDAEYSESEYKDYSWEACKNVGCSCIEYKSGSGYGNCEKDYAFNGTQGPICYVAIGNSCSDAKFSIHEQKFYSWEPCKGRYWSLDAEKYECDGTDIPKGKFQLIDECAAICKYVASMFIFGTNQYGKKRCDSDGCSCYCETSATKEGTCNRVSHDGYRLYKYSLEGCSDDQYQCDNLKCIENRLFQDGKDDCGDGSDEGWKLVAEKHECGGAEIDKGTKKDVDECAAKCKGVASMFIFGTNDYGKTRCSSDGCACYCETSATKKGFCKRVPHDGYRLYKYNPDCSQGDWPEIQACCTNQLPCDEGQGDCDDDSECKGDLVCGQNNCDRSKFPHFNTDCCTAAPTTTTQSTTTTTSTTTPTTTTTSTTTPTTTSTSTTTHTATTTTTASSGTLWQETAKDKECYNFKETASVSNQVECQEHCLADTACAGILYSYKDRNTHHCYTCSSPVLPYSRSNNNFGFYKRPGCVDDNMAGSCEVAINANPHFCQEDFYRLHCRSSCNLCGKVCDDTIPADHFDAGNVKKSGCPKSPGSTCIISKADEQGDVAFKCNHGKWVLADDGYEKITDAWCWPWEGEFKTLTKAKSQCNDDSSCAMIYGSITFHLCRTDSEMKGSGTGNAVYFKKKKN